MGPTKPTICKADCGQLNHFGIYGGEANQPFSSTQPSISLG